MRCPDCAKFVSMETNDPEVETIDIDEAGNVTATVRVVRVCADCGTELKETTLEMETDVSIEGHDSEATNDDGSDKHELLVEETNVEATERSVGKGRYARSYFGACVSFKVTCKCGGLDETGDLSDDCQASYFDELT